MAEPKHDFDKLLIRADLLKAGDNPLKVFPELDKFPEFKLPIALPIGKAVKYIVYCYDRNSPFVISEENILKRKVLCARSAGISVKSKGAVEMLQSRNHKINAMIIRYARMQGDLDYALLVAGYENYFNLIYQMTNEVAKSDDLLDDAKKKNQLFVECRKTLSELKKLAEEIFCGDEQMLDIVDTLNEDEAPTIIGGGIVEHFVSKTNKPKKQVRYKSKSSG